MEKFQKLSRDEMKNVQGRQGGPLVKITCEQNGNYYCLYGYCNQGNLPCITAIGASTFAGCGWIDGCTA